MISCFFRNLLQAFPFCAHDKNAKPALYVLVSVLLSRRLYFQQLALGYRVGFCHLSSPSTLYHILNYIGQFGEKIASEFGNIYIGSIYKLSYPSISMRFSISVKKQRLFLFRALFRSWRTDSSAKSSASFSASISSIHPISTLSSSGM